MIPNTAVRSTRSLKPITIATMLAYAAMNAMSAQAADGVVIIGDSLSDGGYYAVQSRRQQLCARGRKGQFRLIVHSARIRTAPDFRAGDRIFKRKRGSSEQ